MIDQEGSCGWILAATFILSPTFEPDRSCLNKISPIDFAGITTKSKQAAMQYFGTDNVWGVGKSQEITKNLAINIKHTFPILISILIIYFY
jgi:hypothetical protein